MKIHSFAARSAIFFMFCLCGLYSSHLSAQQFNFKHFSVKDGLPHSQVNVVYQDSTGFIWIGTEAGVTRYDGKEFENFQYTNGFPANRVTAIIESRNGIILGTDSGVVVFNKGKFYLQRPATADNFSTIYAFQHVDEERIVLATDKGLYEFAGNKISRIITSTPLDKLPARSCYTDSKKRIWVGTERNGLFLIEYKKGKYQNLVFPDQEKLVTAQIRGITENVDGMIWVATSGDGLYSFDGNGLDKIRLPDNLGEVHFTGMHKDMLGNIWLCTWGSGLIHYQKTYFKALNKTNGLNDDVVTSVTSDRQGNIWAGTFSSGLAFYYGDAFTSLTVRDGLPDNNVRGVVADKNNNVWMATMAGIAMYDGVEVTSWTKKDGLPNERIGAIATDGEKIFAGTMSGEIVIIENNKLVVVRPESGLNLGEIISLIYTPDNSVWIGTAEQGLFRMINGKIEAVNTGNQLLNNPIWALHASDDGNLWLGTKKGVFVMDNGNAIRIQGANEAIPVIPIFAIQSDSQYVYFVSQHKGIWRYGRKTKLVQAFNSEHDGLGSDFCRGLFWTNEKQLYVTHVLGLDQITFLPDTQYIKHYYYSEGLGTDNFSEGIPCRTADGTMYFCSTNGLIIFSTNQQRISDFAPVVNIKKVNLFNQDTDWYLYADSIQNNGLPFRPVFTHDQNQITIHFSSMQFGTGVEVHYEYRLEGFEGFWTQLPNGNSVSYTNLPPGNYQFMVRASNSPGVYSKTTSFYFTITPPFWATWWFFLSCLVILSTIAIILGFLYRRFRADFVRQHRTFGDYQLTTSRLTLFFGAVLYPLSMFICQLFVPSLQLQLGLCIGIGLLLMVAAIGNYYIPLIRKYVHSLAQIGFAIIVLHVLFLNHINHLNPILVLTLMVAMGAGSGVFNDMRPTIIYCVTTVSATAILAFQQGDDALFNPWLLLLAAVVTSVIVFLTVFSRMNIFKRLIFADTTINNTSNIVIASDSEGKIVFVSRSVRSILGYNEQELLGDGWWKVRSEDQTENELIKTQVLSRLGTSAAYITTIRAKNGSKRWIQWTDTEVEAGIKVGIGQDITERKEIEERYRHIVEAATDIIYTADHAGNFTYGNEVIYKITGYTSEEILGSHFTSLIHPDWVGEVKEFYLKQFQKRSSSTYLEFPILHKNGAIVWVGQTVHVLFDEKNADRIRGFEAIARDITEKKKYEEELEKLSLVASETINGVLICDPFGLIEWVNDGFTRITGYELAEVKGKLPGDVLAGDRTDMSAISDVRTRSKQAEGFQKEFLVYHKDQYEIWLSVSNTPIVDENGKILKQIEIFNDITEKKRYEIQLNRYSTRLETLNLVKQELLHSNTLEEVVSNVLGSFVSRIPYLKRASVSLFDEKTGLADLYYVMHIDGNVLKRKAYHMSSLRSLPYLRKNIHLLTANLNVEPFLSESDQENLASGIVSYLITPLFAKGSLIGGVMIGSDQIDAISEDDVEMMREVCDAMANTLLQMKYLEIIEQKNEDISASIQYARRIQDSILPPEDVLRDQISDLFVLYKPKDVLSGDFYWAEKKGKYTFVAVADSTGHGVPGALLSLMGQNLLNQAVHERLFTRPASILDYLNAGIQHTLNQYKQAGELRDGMDISLCVFEEGTYKMEFAGAINPIYLVRDGMMIESKGNRFSIGSYFDNKMRPFTNQEMELQKGDMIYLFSDGYADQFGGEHDRKLSQRRFREYVMSIHQEEMQTQKQLLEEMHRSWIGDSQQTDDICIIGIHVA
jgi:PAS domain S-box-containing protein